MVVEPPAPEALGMAEEVSRVKKYIASLSGAFFYKILYFTTFQHSPECRNVVVEMRLGGFSLLYYPAY